jgi:hypothetical protein
MASHIVKAAAASAPDSECSKHIFAKQAAGLACSSLTPVWALEGIKMSMSSYSDTNCQTCFVVGYCTRNDNAHATTHLVWKDGRITQSGCTAAIAAAFTWPCSVQGSAPWTFSSSTRSSSCQQQAARSSRGGYRVSSQ